MSECEEIANTINRLVEAGHIAKAQELLELALDDYFVLQLAMFANTKVNAHVTIAAWKQAGLRLPAEDTDEFFPYRDSPSVTEEAVSEQKTEPAGHEKQKARMTPEAYIAAVKACPRVAFFHQPRRNAAKVFVRGYATRLDGRQVEVVPDHVLSSRRMVRDYASLSTHNGLFAWGSEVWGKPLLMENVFFGEIPSEEQLRAYYESKHGTPGMLERLLDRLIPSRIQNPAAREWVEEQLEDRRVRDLWERYHCLFDERHVSAMSGGEFERFIAKLYTRLGYSVSLTQGGADQGVDLILSKDGHKIAVQAKRWAGSVSNKAVQEAIAGKLYYGCSHGMIVTSSTFSNSAIALAAKDPTISLIDGKALGKLCEQFRTVRIPDFSWDEWEKIKDVAARFA